LDGKKHGEVSFLLRVNQVKIKPGHSDAALRKRAAEALRIPAQDITAVQIVRRSVDARKKPDIYYSYTLDVSVKREEKVLQKLQGRENLVSRTRECVYHFPEPVKKAGEDPIVIVGMGPAGLFCGYFLALHGYRPILLERGKCVEERQRDVEQFWESGRLNTESNVQFGEGGAGAFSDGKLNTLVHDKEGRNRVVLETLVSFGADERILYDARPHIGTDVLCGIVKRMREEIIRLGGQVRFGCRMTGVCIEQGGLSGIQVRDGMEEENLPCRQLVLAIGHSARDTFSMLYEKGVPMEAKSFAVGLRVEHPQSMVNESQYGMADPGELGAAPYKLTAKTLGGRGVYSFCMCPGGFVVNASSEEGYTAVNGMSYSGRDGKNANSAVIVTVTPEDFGSSHPLAGVEFQRQLEKKAYIAGGGRIPVQRYGDFKRCVEGQACSSDRPVCAKDEIMPQCKGKYVWTDVSRILPRECNEAFVEGMEAFGRQIAGFNRSDACLLGVESRTSSPVRIHRDDSCQSVIRGLYPCGEGAGYAGGIMSAAMDGLRVAEAIAAAD